MSHIERGNIIKKQYIYRMYAVAIRNCEPLNSFEMLETVPTV